MLLRETTFVAVCTVVNATERQGGETHYASTECRRDATDAGATPEEKTPAPHALALTWNTVHASLCCACGVPLCEYQKMKLNVMRRRNLLLKMLKTTRMRQKKRDILLKEIETEGKWQRENKHKQTDFRGKKRNDFKKGKTWRCTKGKIEKKNEQEKTQHRHERQNEEKRSKEKDKWWRKNNSTKEEKQEVRNKEAFTQKMKQTRQDEIDKKSKGAQKVK